MYTAQFPNVVAQIGGDAAVWGGGAFVIVLAAFGVIGFVFWLWALMDVIRNPALDGTIRIVWIFGIVLTGVIGAILYALIGRGQEPRAKTDRC